MKNVIKVKTKILEDLLPYHPFFNPPWDCPPLRPEEIVKADPRLDPYDASKWSPQRFEGRRRRYHEGRVRYLVENWMNDGTNVPDIEVYHGVTVHDGNHRIAAAIMRGDTFIYVEVGGMMDEARELGLDSSSELG